MISELFIFQLFLSFIVGGFAVAIAISLAEKLGSKVGALILSIPTTSLVGFFFIGLTNSPEFVVQAIPFGTIGLTLHLVFVSVFIITFDKFGGKKALAISLVSWLILASLALNYLKFDLMSSLVVYLSLYAITNFYFNRKKSQNISEKPITNTQIFFYRIIFAGLMISFAVALAKFFGPGWGGLFAMFPASTISSLLMLTNGYKKEFVKSVASKMLIFSINFVVYFLAIYFLYQMLGIYIGTVISFLITLIFAYLLKKFI